MQDPMIEIFIYENQQLLESLENVLLEGERSQFLNEEQINEIFRIMHTIKGSSSMMGFDELSKLSHAVEDLFSQIREKGSKNTDWEKLFDIVLSASDMIKSDIENIAKGLDPNGESAKLVEKIHSYLGHIAGGASSPASAEETPAQPGSPSHPHESDEHYDSDEPFYKIKATFESESQMENIRAFGVITALTPHVSRFAHIPEDLMAEDAAKYIVDNGFFIYVQSSGNPDSLKKTVDGVMLLKTSTIVPIPYDSDEIPASIRPKKAVVEEKNQEAQRGGGGVAASSEAIVKQSFISVNVNKLDKLMDLVGEIVTTESMVTKNPEIMNLQLEGFERSSQQLRKLINELQDVVMSVRMVPVSTTFHKMNRIVRDMSKKVNKDVQLNIIGEETEVDKSIIDTLSDPLMHLIRNSVDHGLETPKDRMNVGKPPLGQLTLEARSTGSDVMIIISDDGKGLNRATLLKKAGEKGILTKPESEYSDKEAHSLIFHPGFSTKEQVTEFSGRGVGMDVVRRNIEKVGGNITLESIQGQGTSVIIRIPLTLAIIEGMRFKVGNLGFIVPMLSIQESFKPNMKDVFNDPDGNEMIMIRGECYPIFRLHNIFNITPKVDTLPDGIIIMIHTEDNTYCLFVDELIGEQQAVVKPLPTYIQKHNQNLHGIGGCTILGDGSISLIIDINNLVLKS